MSDLASALRSRRFLSVGVGLALIVLGIILKVGTHDAGQRIRYIPVTRKIASGRVLVKPREGVEYQFLITPEMRNAQAVGNFSAYGGSTNTVSAALMPQAEYASWISGKDAKGFYSSDQKNTDQFAVRLDPGAYSFAISNRISKTTAKFVYLDVELIYYKAEKY